MKIVKNTSPYQTRQIRSVICAVHAHMRKLERRPAPNWKRLRVKIRSRAWGHSGWAYYEGKGRAHGKDWDVLLSLSRQGCTIRQLALLTYHELMHTYGYRHRQFNDIPEQELQQLFPVNEPLAR